MWQSLQRVIYDVSNCWDLGQKVFLISPAVNFENGNISTFEMNKMISRMYNRKYNKMVHFVLILSKCWHNIMPQSVVIILQTNCLKKLFCSLLTNKGLI